MLDAFSLTWWWCSVTKLCLTLCAWTAACQASLSFTISLNLLKLMSTEPAMPSNHLILCCPLLLLPSIFPSIRISSKESVLHIRWPQYWSFSFSISPSSDYPGLISFRMDWLDLLAVQGTLSRVFSNTTVQKHQFFDAKPFHLRWHLNSFHPLLPGYLSSVCVIKRCSVN